MSDRLLFTEAMRPISQRLRAEPRLPSWPQIRAAWRRYRSRQHIADLDGHLLKDIGVSYAEAEAGQQAVLVPVAQP